MIKAKNISKKFERVGGSRIRGTIVENSDLEIE